VVEDVVIKISRSLIAISYPDEFLVLFMNKHTLANTCFVLYELIKLEKIVKAEITLTVMRSGTVS